MPEPVAPINATVSPRLTENDKSDTTLLSPRSYANPTFLNSITGTPSARFTSFTAPLRTERCMTSTSFMRLPETRLRGRIINIMIKSMNAMTTCIAYCVNTVISANISTLSMPTASFMSAAPIQYTASVSPLRHIVIIGIISPNHRDVNSWLDATLSLTVSNLPL